MRGLGALLVSLSLPSWTFVSIRGLPTASSPLPHPLQDRKRVPIIRVRAFALPRFPPGQLTPFRKPRVTLDPRMHQRQEQSIRDRQCLLIDALSPAHHDPPGTVLRECKGGRHIRRDEHLARRGRFGFPFPRPFQPRAAKSRRLPGGDFANASRPGGNHHGLPPIREHARPGFKTDPPEDHCLVRGLVMKPPLVLRNVERQVPAPPDDAVF